MEVSGIVHRPLPLFSGSGIHVQSHSSSKPSLSGLCGDGGIRFLCGDRRLWASHDSRARRFCGVSDSGFSDDGHVQYYYESKTPAICCGCGKKNKVVKGKEKGATEKKMIKKRLKLLKGLSRDLSMFSEMGFGLDLQNDSLVGQVKGKMLSETTELLLGQLQQLRAEEEKLKKRRKEEKAKLRAARMQNRLECVLSSGSSSESSDSECGEVVDMSRLKAEGLPPLPPPPPLVNELQPVMQVAVLTLPSTLTQEGNASEAKLSTVWSTLSQLEVAKTAEERGAEFGSKRIEVCMGGKCKKLGAAALLEEFQRVVGGTEGEAVVGCKCMGKCRDGPNVKVVSNLTDGGCDNSVRTPTPTNNPLCIGVGLDDVGLIVAKFLGDTEKNTALAVAH